MFSGPLKVRATPKRAVLVGKTQSACVVVRNHDLIALRECERTMSTPRATHTRRSGVYMARQRMASRGENCNTFCETDAHGVSRA